MNTKSDIMQILEKEFGEFYSEDKRRKAASKIIDIINTKQKPLIDIAKHARYIISAYNSIMTTKKSDLPKSRTFLIVEKLNYEFDLLDNEIEKIL